MATLVAVAMVAVATSLSHKPGCHPPIVDAAWSPLWQLSFHPVAPNITSQGDSCGGLHVNGTWHVMTSCGGGWTHLTTTDLVHYTSHAQIKIAGGTGSVVPSPDGNGVIGFVNSISKRVVSTNGMRTWAAANTTTVGSPGGRDQARPLQSADGTWFQMMGCGQNAKDGAVCRFRATDPLRLSAWTFDGFLWQSNHTIFGAKFDFCEVPDFYPLTTKKGGVTKHVLVVDPWGSNEWNHSSAVQPLPTPPASYDPHVHNVQWITGTWSHDGKKFEPEKLGCLDYGWWYAARSTADSSNTGRRLMYGNIGSDVVRSPVNPWPEHEAKGLRFFNSLPRDVSLAADGQTVHVRPPPELKGLRASASPTVTAAAERLECGKHRVLSAELRAAEFVVMVNISQLQAGATVGMFVLASAGLEEAVYVGVNSTAVFIDTRQSSVNKTMFDQGFRLQTVLLAPFSRPASGVLQLHVWLDESVVEIFAADCVCSSADMSSCDCEGHSKTAVAVTALAFAGGSGHGAATTSGLFATCAGGGSAGATAGASIWALNAAPVKQLVKSDDGDAGLPWPLRHATARPATTARTLNVRTLGAKPDNATDNSHVFASALRTLREAGGGTLLIPAGGVYLTLPLNLSSGTVLWVEHGATLKALCDSSRWPTIRTLPSYGSFHSSSTGWFAPFVGAFSVHDIILEGGGVVDGSGECFWGPRSTTTMAMKQHGPARGNLLLFEHVQRATLTGLRFVNSPFWTLHLWDSEDIHVDGISVHNPASSDNAALFFGPNTDGIDIDSSNRVLLENSNFHAGDDCVRGKAYTHVYALECLR